MAIRWANFAWLLLSVAVVLIDQWTKVLVSAALALHDEIEVFAYLSWVRWHNDGAAFSFLSGAGGWQRWFFVLLAAVFFVFVLLELKRLQPGQAWYGVAFGLLLGGAAGNFMDRVLQGYVVDFVLVHYETYYFPAFNVADSAIFVGAVLWIALLANAHRKTRRTAGRPAAEGTDDG